MTVKTFVDTNISLYAYDRSAGYKQGELALKVINQQGWLL